MTLSLLTLANGDTNYVSKHNSNYSAIALAVNGILAALNASSTPSLGNLLSALFGNQTAFLDSTSYTTSTSGTTLNVSAGYAWRPDLGNVLAKATSTPINFSGQPAATYYIVLGADGTPALSTTSTFPLWSVVWTGSAFGAITAVAPILPNGDVSGSYQTLVLAAGAVTLAKMAALAANSVIGNNTGSPATPTALALGGANGVASLDGAGKVPLAQLPAAVAGAMSYQGVWNASTNSPTLTSSTGTKGYFYKVSVAGTTALDGLSQWNVGDLVLFDGSAWDKIDGVASEVLSVAGRTGVVTLSTSDVSGAESTANKDVANGYAGLDSSGKLKTSEFPAIRYDIATYYPGVPGGSQTILRWVAPRAVTIPAGATNSQASGGTAATGSATFTIKQLHSGTTTSVGTVAWSASGTTGTFTVSSPISLAAGDVLTIVGPSSADATLADIAITLAATA